jgi:hypothetical protein
VILTNNIIARNPRGGNCSSSAAHRISGNYNLSDRAAQTDTCGDWLSRNNIIVETANLGIDTAPAVSGLIAPSAVIPFLSEGALKDNGGVTRTIALISATGPAINAGDASKCPSTDQRGYVRSGCDLGAVGRPTQAPMLAIQITDSLNGDAQTPKYIPLLTLMNLEVKITNLTVNRIIIDKVELTWAWKKNGITYTGGGAQIALKLNTTTPYNSPVGPQNDISKVTWEKDGGYDVLGNNTIPFSLDALTMRSGDLLIEVKVYEKGNPLPQMQTHQVTIPITHIAFDNGHKALIFWMLYNETSTYQIGYPLPSNLSDAFLRTAPYCDNGLNIVDEA